MLARIKEFFEQNLAPLGGADEPDHEHRLRLSVAALLLEMPRMDETPREEECAAVEQAIRERFGLTDAETRDLLDLAREEARQATDYFQFTSLINRHYSQKQRVEIVDALWRIAYADSLLHPYEEHLVRKIAELLHVPHRTFIAAKHRSRPKG